MAQPQQGFYELYRATSIGTALADTLDDLISSRRIEPQLAMRIMSNFDQSIAQVLNEKVKARMNFKVGPVSACALHVLVVATKDSLFVTGSSRCLPLLRRGLDFRDQGCSLQDGQLADHGRRESQDCCMSV